MSQNVLGSSFTAQMAQALPATSGNVQDESGRLMIDRNDIIVALMGVTGAGKSTFISHFCDGIDIGNGLMSCTNEVRPHLSNSLTQLAQRRVWLVDTPGFDDSTRTDTEVLREVAAFLSDTYHDRILLTGIIYLHRISDNRVGGSGLRQMQMFRKLCGAESMSNVVLATTMWSTVHPDDGIRREQELVTKSGFWKRLIDQGARVFRQDRGIDSAREIVQYVTQKKHQVVFDIQREMVDSNKQLDETAAGMELSAELTKQRIRYENELQSIKSEMQLALTTKDDELSKELQNVKAEVERKLETERAAVRRLQASRDDLYRQMEEQRKRDQEMWQKLMTERDQAEQRRQETIAKQMSDMQAQLHTFQAQAYAPPPSLSPPWQSTYPRHQSTHQPMQPGTMVFTIPSHDDMVKRKRNMKRYCCGCGCFKEASLYDMTGLRMWNLLPCNCGHGCYKCCHIEL